MSLGGDKFFLRGVKLRRRPSSLRLTPELDAANVPPFLPQTGVAPIVDDDGGEDSWFAGVARCFVGVAIAGTAAALASSVAIAGSFNQFNDEIVPTPPPAMGGGVTHTPGPNIVRFYQPDEAPFGAAPALSIDDEAGWQPALPPAPQPLPLAAQQQDELAAPATLLDDDDELGAWPPIRAIIPAPVVQLWTHQDERAPTLLEEDQWPAATLTISPPTVRIWGEPDWAPTAATLAGADDDPAPPAAVPASITSVVWATDDDVIPGLGVDDEYWLRLDSLAARWYGPPPAAQDELGTPAASPAFEEDAWTARRADAAPWVTVWQDADELEAPTPSDDDGWAAPLSAPQALRTLPQPADEFPASPFSLDEDGWAAPRLLPAHPWVAVWQESDELEAPTPDDADAWAPPQPARWAAPSAAFSADEEIVPQPASAVVDDADAWALVPAPAPAAPAQLARADEDWVPPIGIDDDAGWQAPVPQPAPAARLGPPALDDEFVPPPAASLADDDAGWQAVPAAAPRVPPLALFDDDVLPRSAALDEGDGWAPTAPPASAPRLALAAWGDDSEIVPQPPAVPEEEYDLRLFSLPTPPDLRVWTQPDEWAPPVVPLPFDESYWLTFAPLLGQPMPASFPVNQPVDEEFPLLVTPPEPPAPGPSLLGGRRIVRIPPALLEARRVGQFTDDDLLLLIAGAVAAGLLD